MQPYEAMSICAVSVVIHTVISVWRSPTKPDWKQLLGMAAIGVASQPIGVWILSRIVFLGRAQVCQIFGCVLLGVLIVKLLLRPEPREHLHPMWGVITMFVSGIISGMSGMGGPPIVLWLMAHKWSNERIRIALWTIFASMATTNLCWLAFRFREPVWHSMWLGLLFAPITLLGRLPGSWMAGHMSPARMRDMATVILLIVALYAILQPILLPRLGQ